MREVGGGEDRVQKKFIRPQETKGSSTQLRGRNG